MDAERLRALYDEQLRAEAEVADADEVTRIGPLWAATFHASRRGLVTYRAIPAGADVDALLRATIAHYSDDERVDEVEWKTRGHDRIPDLLAQLTRHGFAPEDAETVMAGEVPAVLAADGGVPEGYRVERAGSEAEVLEAAALAGRVFGVPVERARSRAAELVERLRRAPDSMEVWLARDPEGVVVCSGRVEFVEGTDFAGVWGGACDPAHRGRGLYRAITAGRARSARAHGALYLHADCTAYSRPILERAGLVAITTSTPALWRRAAG